MFIYAVVCMAIIISIEFCLEIEITYIVVYNTRSEFEEFERDKQQQLYHVSICFGSFFRAAHSHAKDGALWILHL